MAIKIDDRLVRGDDGEIKVGSAENVRISEDEAKKVALYDSFRDTNRIPQELYAGDTVKRGLRNADGTGVLAGITQISNVHGYEMRDGRKVPVEGSVTLRGLPIC